MELSIKKEKAAFNTSKLGKEKNCVVVEFPNCISTKTGKPFKWMPTYLQIAKIMNALEECEKESWS